MSEEKKVVRTFRIAGFSAESGVHLDAETVTALTTHMDLVFAVVKMHMPNYKPEDWQGYANMRVALEKAATGQNDGRIYAHRGMTGIDDGEPEHEVGWCKEHEKEHFVRPDGSCYESTSKEEEE